MEPLKHIDKDTPIGTRVLVVGPEGWEIYMGEFRGFDSFGRADIRGADGVISSYFSYSVHLQPEASNGQD